MADFGSTDAPAPVGQSGAGVIGVDVGGTKILGLRILGDSIQDRERVPSTAPGRSVLDQIDLVVEELIARSPQKPSGIGVGIAGFVGMDGIALTAPNTPGLVGADLKSSLGDRHGIPVSVNNDANCVAIAAARQRRTTGGLVAITIGTGVGGGFVLNRELLRGYHGYAAEPGHMVVDPDGPQCPCGNRGCWERFASGSGLGWLARRAAGRGRGEALVSRAGSIEAITGETVTALLAEREPAAAAVFEEFIFYLTLGVANMIMLLDPQEIVIGGGVAELREDLLEPLVACLGEKFPAATAHRQTTISIADLGEEAGAWGAALLADPTPEFQ